MVKITSFTANHIALAIAVVLGIVADSLSCDAAEHAGSNAQEAALKQLVIHDQFGRRFDLQGQIGKVVIVDFWANWCPNCIAEMKDLEALQKAIGPDRLEIVLVSNPKDWSTDLVYARTHGIPFPLYVRDGRKPNVTAAAMDGQVQANGGVEYHLPYAAIFAPSGHLIRTYLGRQGWASPAVEAHLREVAQQR